MTLPSYLLPLELTCFEYRGRMRAGMTQSHKVVARDARGRAVNIVLKLRDPGTPRGHFGPTSLATELLVAVLARHLGISVPDYGIAHVGPIFANGISKDEDREILVRNIGENFASVMLEPQRMAWDPDCRSQSEELHEAIEDVLTLDAAILNGDRTRDNPNLLWDGAEEVHAIDHGLACFVHMLDDETIAALPAVLTESHIQNHCGYVFLRGHDSPFKRVLDRWREFASPEFLESLRRVIPSGWERRPGDHDRIFRFLLERESRFVDITSELRRIVR